MPYSTAYFHTSPSSFLQACYLRKLLMQVENSKKQDRGKDCFPPHQQFCILSYVSNLIIVVVFLVQHAKCGLTSVYRKHFLVLHKKNTVGFGMCLLRI